MTTDSLSVQERLYPALTCFGCGPANERGLRLRSFPRADEVVAQFSPRPEHDNGLGYLNGGIISTVLDCHSAAAVLLEAHERGWVGGDLGSLPFVTSGLDVRFRRPAPLDETLGLRAALVSVAEPEMTAHVELVHGGKVCASATAVWKRWRPRS